MVMCNQTEFKKVPLRYICGVLYMNFQLLWEPSLKIIETHAHGLDTLTFWSVYGELLRRADSLIETTDELIVDTLECEYKKLVEFYEDWQKFESKPDFVNHRILLWRGLTSFPDVAEKKTRDTSELLLRFYQKEFTKYNPELATTWSIKQNDSEVLEETLDLEEEKESLEEESKNKRKSISKNSSKLNAKTKVKTFLQYLSVFSKIKSPKSMYREPELYSLYFELLQHKSSEIQKIALDCLLTYKQKFLVPYKENLYNLIDDKNFKNELATFNVDREGSTVLEEYRDDLMPVVLRIVYSKMNAKIGLRTGGKSSGQHRRILVIRFLGGCHEKEKLIFIKMIFKYFEKYIEEDLDKVVRNVDLEKFIPPKRLQSSINMLNVILEQFGDSLANELLTQFLKYIHLIGAFVKGAFQQMSNVHVGYQASLKILRTSSIKLVHLFFEKFQQYLWDTKQINDTFDIFVWPYLSKLNIEGIHSPTALLKLIILWGTEPRYFSLLVKQSGDEKLLILPQVMALLLNPKTHYSVTNIILEMVEKLLTLQPDEEDSKVPVEGVLPIDQNILNRLKVNDKLNYGSCILLPHIPSVLLKIQKSLERKSKNLNRRELFILSRISELVWESDISEQTLELLLPVVLKKCSGCLDEDVVNQFLTSVKNLLQNVVEPKKFIRHLLPLFGEVTSSSGRKILLSIIDLMIVDTNLTSLRDITSELNAFDSKWIDQPDFQRRHDCFKSIHNLIEENKIEIDLGILLIFNCYHFLNGEKDLSLKENASFLLKTLCPYLLMKYKASKKDNDYLLDTMFNLIRKGMKSRKDDLRNECISLLGSLARKCPENHFILRDLNVFTNDVDVEVDIFENLVHLQVHRHARALGKFCQILREQSVMPNAQTMTRFVLPLASSYLCNEKYAGKNSVIDSAIDTIGIICRVLPWHQYEGVLKFYLSKLRGKVTYQKQLVRLIVAILDAFHFDLNKANKLEVKVDLKSDENKDEENKDDVKSLGDDADEDINEALESIAEKVEENEDEEESDENVVRICEKTTVLCKSTATRVIYTIQTVLLPQLYKSLAEMTQRDTSHKINRKLTSYEQEEEDLIKVPLSLAVVKLLQRLPQEILEINLPGIFMKTCTFLKSHLESVRKVARETLQKMMLGLGPVYLGLLLGEMSALLQRGFQAHVLIYTVHGVLNCLKEHYKPNDIDKVLLTVLKLCNTDLFGILSEEKEIAKIKVKTSEAKSSKSLDTYQILSQFITEKCLMDLLQPLKKILETARSYKTVYKTQECLRCIAAGLVDNKFVSTESLLKFAYGTASEKIPQLVLGKNKPELTEKERNLLHRSKPDCYIIPKAPVGRSGVRINDVKSCDKANAHILVEFGLKLCFILLKRDRLKDGDYRPFLDPFVVLFTKCLNSKHVKLSTVTLQCLNWFFKYELPSMKEHIKDIAADMFLILHKYAASGLSKGDNFDLVVAAFKAMSILLRDVKYHTIEKDQLKVLLLYVEQDMYDYDRQAVAFNLLKTILSRKLIIPEIHEIMGKVAELSITSELEHVRNQARGVFHQFLMDYPLGKKLETHVSFYLHQASFEMQYGRESALEMIQTLINSFPMKILILHSGTILITLGARLVNEEVPELRKIVATCLTTMLNRLPKADRQPLFEIVTLWFSDKNISHRRLAAQLCGIFVAVEKAYFENRFPQILPIILRQFGLNENPGQFVKIKKDEEEVDNEEKTRIRDHHYFQVLQLLLKLCGQCPGFLKQKKTVNNLAFYCQSLLNYPHDWVRLAACQFLGFVLASTDIEHLSCLLLEDKQDDSGYLTNDPNNCIKSLALDLCDQLQPGNLKSDLAEQVIKNLVFIARVLEKVPIQGEESKKVNLLWLSKRIRKIVYSEIIENSSNIVIRTEVFKWIAGVCTALKTETVLSILHHLMSPLVREMLTTEESNAPLRQLSKEVGNIIKKKVGLEKYTETLSKLQQTLSVRRAERKRSRNQLAVVDPELYAKKKIKRNEKKKDVKKRKIAELKGVKKVFKKRKIADLEDNSEVM
ncbi:hypothetical protein HHI36_019388 [Cryptolaemus montrouzieri]|uniref:Small subunit processome component 20 homolog n=1 Tax=Cryptolaemus montrouzieri TaxID=559131 RepID=A0ABD2P3F3_9CUCU